MGAPFARARVRAATIAAAIVPLALCATQPRADDVLIDGIAVVIGSSAADEEDASALLLSDIELTAALLLASRRGPEAALLPPPPEEWRAARRMAVLVRLLAARARYLHETIGEPEKRAVRDEIARLVGGDIPLYRILTSVGLAPQDIDSFTETTALALTQLADFEAQADLTERRRPGSGEQQAPPDIARQYRRLVREARTNDQLERWISELAQGGHIRIIR